MRWPTAGSEPTRSRGAGGLLIRVAPAAALVVVLHVLAIDGVARLPGPRLEATPMAPMVEALAVRSIDVAPPAPPPIHSAAHHPVRRADPAPPPAAQATTTEGAARRAEAAPFDGSAGDERYYEPDEVDTPAIPQSDWQIDIGRLLALQVRRFSAEILIGADGQAQQCTLGEIEPPLVAPPGSDPGSELAAELCRTPLRPAERGGRPVASVRRIELMLSTN